MAKCIEEAKTCGCHSPRKAVRWNLCPQHLHSSSLMVTTRYKELEALCRAAIRDSTARRGAVQPRVSSWRAATSTREQHRAASRNQGKALVQPPCCRQCCLAELCPGKEPPELLRSPARLHHLNLGPWEVPKSWKAACTRAQTL